MRIEYEEKLDYCDVLIRPKRSTLSSRSEVNLERQFSLPCGIVQTFVPIAAANMDGVGTLSMAKTLYNFNMLTCLHKYHTVDDIKKVEDKNILKNVAISTGTSDSDLDNLNKILEYNEKELNNTIRFICIDVANGYSEHFIDFVKKTRDSYGNKYAIIAGNVATPDVTEQLILAGADIVKVGIGPGAVCLTRQVTGVGYPQLSAVIECADAAHGLGGFVMADGGCVTSGDVAKAFAAGGDFVMLGTMLAGHEEADDYKLISKDNKYYMEFYGMSSYSAQKKHGNVKDYRASEGRTILIPFKGSAAQTVNEILGGVRSSCTYIGAKTIKEMPKRATFICVRRQLNTSHDDKTIGN